MDWRHYESEIFEKLRRQFPGTELVRDARLEGRISGIQRQIDILVRGQLLDSRPFAVVDCKYFAKRIDISVVESFLGLLADVRAHVGLMITNIGYSEAADRRARNDQTREVNLHVVDWTDMQEKLPTYRVLYFGDLGVRLAIPPGWTLDGGQERIPGMASWDLLPSDLSREAAYRLPRWGCISLIPVLPQQALPTARRLFWDQHAIAQGHGQTEYRAEDNGTGDITYRRTRGSSGKVEFGAMCLTTDLMVVVEVQTTPEHESADEALLVQVAKSIVALAISEPGDGISHSEAWEAVAPRIFGGSSDDPNPGR